MLEDRKASSGKGQHQYLRRRGEITAGQCWLSRSRVPARPHARHFSAATIRARGRQPSQTISAMTISAGKVLVGRRMVRSDRDCVFSLQSVMEILHASTASQGGAISFVVVPSLYSQRGFAAAKGPRWENTPMSASGVVCAAP